MPDEELAELRRVMMMGEEEKARHLKAIHVSREGRRNMVCVYLVGGMLKAIKITGSV